MRAYGADADAVAAAFARLRSAWREARSEPATSCTFGAEREALRRSLDGLTALSFLDDTIYPHEQAQWDLTMLGAAIRGVRHARWGAAQRAVGAVDLNGLAAILSRASFEVEQLHHDPGYERISWGGQGQLSEPLDLYALYRALGRAGTGGPADPQVWLRELRAARGTTVEVYRDRVREVAATIDATAVELEAVPACA
jgi:hypothetical protein